MKKIKITVRWFDGFNREYHPIDFEFGNSYLWMKFDNNKEKEKWGINSTINSLSYSRCTNDIESLL